MIIRYDDNVINKYQQIYQYVQRSYLDKIILYCINSDLRKAVNVKEWIREQVTNPSNSILEFIKNIPDHSNYDNQIFEIFKWVRLNIEYRSDSLIWHMTEHWNTVTETIDKSFGDCEDLSLLIYVFARLKGVPEDRLLIGCGDVECSGSTCGHAFLLYKPINYPLNWVILDTCFYYSSLSIEERNKFFIYNKQFKEYKKINSSEYREVVSKYIKAWFYFNENSSYTDLQGVI